jgi:hypothetical protein
LNFSSLGRPIGLPLVDDNCSRFDFDHPPFSSAAKYLNIAKRFNASESLADAFRLLH